MTIIRTMCNMPFYILKLEKNLAFLKFFYRFRTYQVNPVAKRGSMLCEMIKDRDKRKNWHFNIVPPTPSKRKNIFEKVYKPSRRQSVLNSLFIKNITDVLSTGDVAPEVLGHGIEITGVKVSPCYQILNVYWQVPPHNSDSCDKLATMLSERAHEIRSELISRNVLGRVPKIYFIRDCTNAEIAAFEEALKKVQAELDSLGDNSIVPDDSFTKDVFSFKTPKTEEKKTESFNVTLARAPDVPPPRPPDMKSNVFGVDHDSIMKKVVALKKKESTSHSSAVVSQACFESGDLFSKIPGTTLHDDYSQREKILKKFQLERKLLKEKKSLPAQEEEEENITFVSYEDFPEPGIEDFIEEDPDKNSQT